MNDPASTPSATTPTLIDTRALPLESRIAHQAYTLWDGYGRPEGRDVAIWLEAEHQVLGVDARVNDQAGGAVSAPALNSALSPHLPAASTPDGSTVTGRRPRSAPRETSGVLPVRRG